MAERDSVVSNFPAPGPTRTVTICFAGCLSENRIKVTGQEIALFRQILADQTWGTLPHLWEEMMESTVPFQMELNDKSGK